VNPARTPLVAGNWKMFKGGLAGIELAGQIARLAKEMKGVDLVIAPPFTALAACAHELEGSGAALAAQNMHAKAEGAFTGEIAAPFLVEAGCTWVILGHSERRQYFGETDAAVAEKVAAAFAHKLRPIACVGEQLAEREAGQTLEVVGRQVKALLPILAAHEATPAAIAYEPVWAIGTGKTAGPAEAEEVHAAIRAWLAAASPALAQRTRILYGGSCKPENAAALMGCPNVDGGLIGGASLEAASFGAIARAAHGLLRPS
jgi:triosephosphate isomerase